MKKKFINLFIMLIPIKKYRKKARFYLMKFTFSMFSEFKTFNNHDIKNKTVLIFEPNNSHAEVIIGYIKYLIDLGFNVDILTTKENANSNFLYSFQDNKNINLFIANETLYAKYFKSQKIKNYDFIWFSSVKYYANYIKKNNIIDYIGFMPQGKNKTLFTIHDTFDFDEKTLNSLLKSNQIISLANFTKGVMINPHYFCKYPILAKNNITTFITIGAITSQRRNYQMLFDAIKKLVLNDYKFKIIIISRSEATNIPKDTTKHIEFKYNLDFPDMYKEIIKSDFFLPLLDPENIKHDRYITTGATGSTQLIYGFSKPCLIHKKFASHYMLDEKNSINYDNDFYASMIKAIDMDQNSYKELQENISKTAHNIQKSSIKNLKKILNMQKDIN